MMNPKRAVLIGLLLLVTGFTHGQITQKVAEMELILSPGESDTIWYAFEQGDQIMIHAKESGAKVPIAVGIAPLGGSDVFSKVDFKKLSKEWISVSSRQVYEFRLKNLDMERPCQLELRIDRVPASPELADFKTDVQWTHVIDTGGSNAHTGVRLRPDTLVIQKVVRRWIKTDTAEYKVIDRTQTVHSQLHTDGPEIRLAITLPEDKKEGLGEKRMIAWAYWIGVGDEAKNVWNQQVQAMKSFTKGVTGIYATPLGALAIGLLTELLLPESGDDIDYQLQAVSQSHGKSSIGSNAVLDHGSDVTASYKRFNPSKNRRLELLLQSDNIAYPVEVQVIVVAMVETRHFRNEEFTYRKPGWLMKVPIVQH